MGYLLDTNIVSAIVNQSSKIRQKLLDVDIQTQELFISCMTYYEVKRGLVYVNATRKLSIFDDFCEIATILFLDTVEVLETASEIHVHLRRTGRPIQDADILIAATAITHNLTLVSNDSDLLRVPGVRLENWLD